MIFGSGLNLLSAALGFGMTAVFVAFVCARFICCRARGADDSAPTPVDFDVDFPADLERPVEDANCGLEPLVIAAIPIMKYSEALYSKDDAQCINLHPFQAGPKKFTSKSIALQTCLHRLNQAQTQPNI
ncbi:hypothetical protein ACQJBY_011076 [Aegilops geniculata]